MTESAFTITRNYQDSYTPGILSVDSTGDFFCDTIELKDNNNQPQISCIPEGVYSYYKYFSPHLKTTVLMLENVPDRENAEIHWGNTILNIKGCAIVGIKGTLEVNGVLYPAVLKSDNTLEKLIALAADKGQITITS